MERWQEAEGLYSIDSSLEPTGDCGSSRPIYRQVGGNGFIWADNYNDYWQRTTVLCDLSDATKEFFATNNLFSVSDYDYAPTTVPSEVDSWEIMSYSRSNPTSSSLTVKDGASGTCGL